MAEVLRCANVEVRRGEKIILEDVSWTVNEGERWVILGPNGAGKTTLLQLAAGRMHPTSGHVEVLGEELGDVDIFELRPRIGFSSAALADEIPGRARVIDIVRTAAYGIMQTWREEYDEDDQERANSLLEAFSVADLANRRFSSLSEGERKRVQIARALMSDPELLLLDEPAGGLDLGGRARRLGRLTNITGAETSPLLVMITHQVEEIPVGFTHALLLREGRVAAAGALDEVLTPQLLSEVFGMNLVVEQHRDRWSARALDSQD